MAELTDLLDLSAWPEGTRLICRRERPHPGAQLRFTDPESHPTSASSPTSETARWPASSFATASTPGSRNRIQESQELGLGRLSCQDWERNEVWFGLAELAGDLLAWLLTGA